MMNVKLFVATHKIYEIPKDPLYTPLFVGSVGKENPFDGCLRDDAGENISDRNPYYCELTGLYWAWKNTDADAYGMAQYRRHFSLRPKKTGDVGERIKRALSLSEAETLLQDYDAIVPKKRRYYIESLKSHYEHTMGQKHLDLARDFIAKKYPEYLPYVDEVYHQSWGYMFNMFLIKREFADDYCKWVFDILFSLEKEIDAEHLSTFHKRLFGRISEILFNAWVKKACDDGMKIVEVSVVSMESENWIKRGTSFLKAKFFGKTYEESF